MYEVLNKNFSVIFKEKILYLLIAIGLLSCNTTNHKNVAQRPNILFIISDDQGYPHASAYGCPFVNTPTFDYIAKKGLLFTNFFVTAPQCSPSRASILTGRQIWQNGPAGTHWSSFSSGLTTYTDVLTKNGYRVGYTGKGWAPGNWIDGGRKTNPAGVKYVDIKDAEAYRKTIPTNGISHENYAGSFKMFLDKTNKKQPFCFWMGGWEPHRPYEEGSGLKHGGKLSSVNIPAYLPLSDTVKNDLLDYALEIEWFDKQAGKAIELLKKRGMLDNTLVIFTSDNGLPFPRAKAYSFDAGNHVPLAIMWKGHIMNPGRTIADLISSLDFFPTFLAAAGLKEEAAQAEGKSLFDVFKNGKSGVTEKSRKYIFWGRERHGNARWDNLGYPQRAIRTDHYLYIWNPKPERYPAGSPKVYSGKELVWNYGDIDPSPTKDYMIVHRNDTLSKMAFEKFPGEMLYDIKKDPFCMNNLAYNRNYQKIREELSDILKKKLKNTQDPRVGKYPDVWESYRRYGPIHRFPRPAWADSIIVKSQVIN